MESLERHTRGRNTYIPLLYVLLQINYYGS